MLILTQQTCVFHHVDGDDGDDDDDDDDGDDVLNYLENARDHQM